MIALIVALCITLNGAAKQPGPAMQQALETLNPPCYMNWLASDELLADDRYLPELWWLKANKLGEFKVKTVTRSHKLWLFWSEPERVDQANTAPDVAATLTISYVQALGSNGKFGCCGNIVDGNGLAWLGAYLTSGGQVPDIWHIHIYASSLAEWRDRLNDWWAWWNVHGQGRPVIISETSLMWQPAADQAELMDYLMGLDDPRIQQIYWFSALQEPSVPSWSAVNLLNSDMTKTTLGKLYSPDREPTATPPAPPTFTPTDVPEATETPTGETPPRLTYLPYMVLQ